MLSLRWVAVVVAGALLSAGRSGAADSPSVAARAAPLAIGNVSEVDVAAVRRVLERAEPPRDAPAAAALVLTLEGAIRIALESNLQLQIAALDRDTAEALVPAAEAKYHPTPGFDALVRGDHVVDGPNDPTSPGTIVPGTQRDGRQIALPFVRQELPTGGTLTLVGGFDRKVTEDPVQPQPGEKKVDHLYLGGTTLVLRQPLLRGGGMYVASRPILDSEYNLDVAEALLLSQILQVTALTKQAYYNTVLGQRLIEVTEHALERDHQLLEASQALFTGGRASRRDVLSAQIRVSDDESSLAKNRASFDNAQLALRDVLGTPIGQAVLPAESTIPFDPVEIRLGTWIEEALTNRPEIRAILARLDQSQLAVRIAGNDALPALDLLSAYTRGDFSENASTLYTGFQSQVWSAGLHFEIPFGNVAARERLRAARFQQERVVHELRQQKRAIEIEVRNEEVGLRKNLANLSAQTDKVQQAREKFEIANTRFRLGLANNFDVTDAQEALVAAESEFLSAMVDYNNSVARLEASVAGPL